MLIFGKIDGLVYIGGIKIECIVMFK